MQKQQQQQPADDTARVKVLSPGMMVYKRFIRNKLAIIGLAIIAAMFLFSFAGGFFYPHGQAQVFKGEAHINLEYAIATYNTELRLYAAEGVTFPPQAYAPFLLALSTNDREFTHGGVNYIIMDEGGEFYKIGGYVTLAEGDEFRGMIAWRDGEEGSPELPAKLKKAFEDAHADGYDEFIFEGVTYHVIRGNRSCAIAVYQDFAVASRRAFDAYDPAGAGVVSSYGFRLAVEEAMFNDDDYFSYGGSSYRMEMLDADNGTVFDSSGEAFADISVIIITPPTGSGITHPIAFKKDIREAIVESVPFFWTETANGERTRFDVQRINQHFFVRTDQLTEVIEIYYPPSKQNWLGTDANGMDILARLMYGGRISLTLGFVVVLVQLFIGVVFGGISSYFGGWVDTVMMRFVDLFNTIPYFPMMIILGSILDAYRVDPVQRIYILMMLLGIMGWTGIARTVRGQILSLREQDFMIAAEAAGLSVGRRIFKHLVPNVMPLLIINATMGLGGIIITEATLSFLGMGVKYPLASWGQMSNAAINETVLTFYPWTWLPAGILIFSTVLGFMFVGDGLRDAFDPKMKR